MQKDYSRIVPKEMEKKLEGNFRSLNTSGWALFWRGKRVALKRGKVDIYPSRAAAIDALSRNLHGFDWYDYIFRKHGYSGHDDKRLTKEVVRRKDIYGNMREESKMTDEYYRLVGIASHSTDFLIRHYLKTGDLDIKLI
jgi:hypothetical protein